MHEVAEAGAGAFPHLILAAAGLSEVSDRRQLCVDGSATKPPVVQLLDSTLCVLLAAKFDVDITNLEQLKQAFLFNHCAATQATTVAGKLSFGEI